MVVAEVLSTERTSLGQSVKKSSLKTEASLMMHQDQPKHIRAHLSRFIYLLIH